MYFQNQWPRSNVRVTHQRKNPHFGDETMDCETRERHAGVKTDCKGSDNKSRPPGYRFSLNALVLQWGKHAEWEPRCSKSVPLHSRALACLSERETEREAL